MSNDAPPLKVVVLISTLIENMPLRHGYPASGVAYHDGILRHLSQGCLLPGLYFV